MIWLSKLIILLVALLLPGICLAANAVPGYKSGHPVVYAITPLGGTPLGDPEAETGATAFEPQVLSSLSACEALSDNTPWVTAGTSVFCMPCDEAGKAWSSGVSDTTATIFAELQTSVTSFVGVMPEALAYPDFSGGGFDSAAYIISSTASDVIAEDNTAGVALYFEGIQIVGYSAGDDLFWSRTNSPARIELKNMYLAGNGGTGDRGVFYSVADETGELYIWNSVVSGYKLSNGIESDDAGVTVVHCAVMGSAEDGLDSAANDIFVYNTVIFNTVDDFQDTFAVNTNNASDDNEGVNPQNLNENAGGEWTAAFEDWANDDFRAKAGGLLENTGTGGISWTTLMGDTDPLATDMAGTARSGVSPEIGPFEITAAATSENAQNTGGFLIKNSDYQKRFPDFRKIVR